MPNAVKHKEEGLRRPNTNKMSAKRKSYCAAYKLEIVKYAVVYGNRAAGRMFGVSEGMVRNWRKSKDMLAAMKETKKANRGLKPRWPELEKRLIEWVLEQRAAGRSLTLAQLRLHALVVAKEININDFAGGPSWCTRFMRRNQLSDNRRVRTKASEVDHFLEFVEEQTGHSPSTPSRSSINVEKPKTSVFAPLVTILSPSASSPSGSSGFPIISHVCSLTTPPSRGKRGNADEPRSTQKRHRVNALIDVDRLSSAAVSSDDSNESISILQPNTLGFESSNTHVSNTSFGPKAAGITSSPAPPLGMAHTVTQTDAPMTVKKEKLEETEERVNARGIQQRSIKQESDRQTANRNKSLQTEEPIYCIDSDDEEVTQLLHRLSDQDIKCEEHDAVSRNSHGTSRTELPKDYRTLFKKAKQNVNLLVSSRAALLEGAETKPSTGAVEEEDEEVGDITRQVQSLVRALDERTRETDQLRSQLASLERERKFLSLQRTDLRMKLLQQPRQQTQNCTQTENRASSPDTYKSLIELRHNIGRLLVNFVPYLDLGQVNYECNVIDEILEQVVSDDKYSNWSKASCSNCTGR